jgi:hypothetical protein
MLVILNLFAKKQEENSTLEKKFSKTASKEEKVD